MADPVLRVENLTKLFGGLAAVNDVSLDLHLGQVHAVIGPNGAGKSTLTNLISGELTPTSGSIRYLAHGEGEFDLAGLSSDRISRLGIGRSFQKTNIFLPFTAFENCRLAAQSRQQRAWRIFRGASRYADVNAIAEHSLQSAGLAERGQVNAAMLSHGEQRQLEIAMCLATQPRILLMDEPLAGMGPQESLRIVALIRQLAAEHAILLIEHDMDAVFAVAHCLTVMVNGEVIESGTPQAVRASAHVQQAYLGEAHGDTHD
ncbi:MAG: ABC transporter ATP-binding protein [Betaproteobacteria bacterium]|nr:ABC transporter ATP-binding protein [Betaproteobacteria bacterium]